MWSRTRIAVTALYVAYGLAVILLTDSIWVHLALFAVGLAALYAVVLLLVARDRRSAKSLRR